MANTTYTVGDQTYIVNDQGTIVGGNNSGYGYQYTNSGNSGSSATTPAPVQTSPASTVSAPSPVSTGGGGGGGGSSAPSGYNGSYFVGTPGQSDKDRTLAAIDYYTQNNMTEQLKTAQEWAKQMGYTTTQNTTPASVTTPMQNTSLTPGYNPGAGYFVGAPGQSDKDRTQEAINYYWENGMQDKYEKALSYAYSKGYDVTMPSQIPKTPVPIQINPFQAQYQNILAQLQAKYNQAVDIEGNPIYIAGLNAANLQADKAAQKTMEQMNSRGILNSTVTGDRVAQARQDTIASILPALMEKVYNINANEVSQLINLANLYGNQSNQWEEQQIAAQQAQAAKMQAQIEAKEAEVKQALEIVKALGYANNWAASILGIEPGTSSFEAQKAAAELQKSLEVAKIQANASMSNAATSANASIYNTQQKIAANQNSNNLLQTAITYAMKDPAYAYAATTEDKQALIDYYMSLLLSQQNSNGLTDEQLLEALQ